MVDKSSCIAKLPRNMVEDAVSKIEPPKEGDFI